MEGQDQGAARGEHLERGVGPEALRTGNVRQRRPLELLQVYPGVADKGHGLAHIRLEPAVERAGPSLLIALREASDGTGVTTGITKRQSMINPSGTVRVRKLIPLGREPRSREVAA